MASIQKITPCLWFNDNAEEAAKFYTGIFPDSRIVNVALYPDVGQETHGRAAGSVMVVKFVLCGQEFVGLNGGPMFKFSEAISLMINCKDQKEIDYYWDKLGSAGGGQDSMCGWLKDKFGLSWQVAPDNFEQWYADNTSPASQRVMAAMMTMHKIDMAAMQRAFEGK